MLQRAIGSVSGGGFQGIHDHFDNYVSANKKTYDLDFDPTIIFVKGKNYGASISTQWDEWSSTWWSDLSGYATQSYKWHDGSTGSVIYPLPDTQHGPAINIVNDGNRHIEITLSNGSVTNYDVDIWIM